MYMNLNFNYHDATLETISLQHTDLVLTIALYSIFYPNMQHLQIKGSGITNSITCEKWVTKVVAAFQEENEASLGARINDIYVDKNKLIIAVDSMKPVKLNFEYFKEILNPTTCS